MKATINRESFAKHYAAAAAVAPTKSPQSAIQSVMLTAGPTPTLTATDMETTLRVPLGDSIEVERPGSVLLPSAMGQILRECSGETIRLTLQDDHLLVVCGSSEFDLLTQSADEFPANAEVDSSSIATVAGDSLRCLIRRTVFCCDGDSSRYALGGVRLERDGVRLVGAATDGRRLGVMAIDAAGEATPFDSLIVPSRALELLQRWLPDGVTVEIRTIGNSGVRFAAPSLTLDSRLVEGRFPKWRDVLPTSAPHEISMQAGPLGATIRQVSIATDQDGGCEFTFSGGKLTVRATSQTRGKAAAELPISFDGDVSIRLSPRFLLEFLKLCETTETIYWSMTDEKSACLLEAAGGWRYVVMPLTRE